MRSPVQPDIPKTPLAVVLKGYPRLSETFIAQEILELERRGFDITIYSLRQPYDPDIHPIHREIQAAVHYLPEYLHQQPMRVLKALVANCTLGGFWSSAGHFIKDFCRDPTRNRIRRFGQALVLSHERDRRCQWLYAHFMHTPASVASYASTLTGLPWSISAHAKDIWTLQEWEKKQKLRSVRWLVTCTASNYQHLRALADDPNKVNLLYHGIDLNRFPDPRPAQTHTQSDSAQTISIVSVGRLVEKKGYQFLLQALARLPASQNWHFTHIGGGTLQSELAAQATQLGLADKITWLGSQPQQRVLELYRESDLFVLPSIVGADGDRDGLPNVLMEAQSQRLACLSTNISGIPELIEHGVTGWLVAQQDSAALTTALSLLLDDPALRARLASAGFDRLHREFSHRVCIEKLASLLSDPPAAAAPG